MFDVPIVMPESAEGSARGAAILGLIALGIKSGIDNFVDPATEQRRVYPRKEVHTYYQKQYQKFQKLLGYARDFQKN
jgi:sugar (pentulose or hexulose) kinase